MKNLNVYIQEKLGSKVFAIVDETEAILDVFPSKEEADKVAREYPEEAHAKVKEIERSEICDKD